MSETQATFDGYRPGDLGRVIWLHGDYYHRHWGFDLSFEAQEARELAEFLERLDPARDLFLAARLAGELVGAVALDGAAPEGARLRWFIMAQAAQGRGLGRELIRRLLDFGRRAGHRRVFLWTFEGLTTARRLYEAAGFTLAQERLVEQWGGTVREQRFDLLL